MIEQIITDVLFEPRSIEMLYPNSFLIGFIHLPDKRVHSIDICATHYNLEKAKTNPCCIAKWGIQAGDFVFLKDGTIMSVFEADAANIDYSFDTPEAAYGWFVGLKASNKIKPIIKYP